MVREGGQVFDERYELGEVLGSGGTGTVHRAWDRVLARPVAIKMLHAGAGGDDTHRARLRAEARLAGALQHPGIAQVFDYGEDTSTTPTTPYIVMQYVEGVPLSQVLRDSRTLPPEQVMSIVAQIAAALDVAHGAGIVHRDLKPGNILITPEGRPVLVDFGIARSASLEPLTLTGTIVGTVDYISPEQTAGRSATALSDIYALGMVAYESLTGLRPFRRENQVATAIAHLNDEAPALGDDVPVEVRDLVTAMIAKDPDARPATAADVATLAAIASGQPVDPEATVAVALPAVRPSAGRQATGSVPVAERPWGSRRRYGAAAAALVALVSVFAFVAARPAPTAVPGVVGLRAAAAERALDRAGLDVRRASVDGPAPAGRVLAQSPAAGKQVSDGAIVTITVASGQVEFAPGPILGLDFDEASSRLAKLGLVARRRDVPRQRGVGTVVAADRSGLLSTGSVVTLSVAVAPLAGPAPTSTTTRSSQPRRHRTRAATHTALAGSRPRRQREAQGQEEVAATPRVRRGSVAAMERAPTIVIVDDAAEVRVLVMARLRLSGLFDVLGEGANGSDAVALAERHRPRLLLLDVSMPETDGLQALPRILEVSPDTRVVLYSGFEEQGLAEKAQELGAAAFIEKSAPVEVLVDRLLDVAAPAAERRTSALPARGEVDDPVVKAALDPGVLEEHLERFREVFEEAAIGMATMTLTGRVVRGNAALASLVQHPVADLVGTYYGDLTDGAEDTVDAALDDVRLRPARRRPVRARAGGRNRSSPAQGDARARPGLQRPGPLPVPAGPGRDLGTSDGRGAPQERGALPSPRRSSRGLRDLHAGPDRARHELEQRRPAQQGLHRRRDHRPALRDLLPGGRPGPQASRVRARGRAA